MANPYQNFRRKTKDFFHKWWMPLMALILIGGCGGAFLGLFVTESTSMAMLIMMSLLIPSFGGLAAPAMLATVFFIGATVGAFIGLALLFGHCCIHRTNQYLEDVGELPEVEGNIKKQSYKPFKEEEKTNLIINLDAAPNPGAESSNRSFI